MMTEEAVSPVVAIMLMLVVTIIIAAVVSGFAGAMATGKNQAPHATISATYSLSKGMMIYHEGGDDLTWYNIKLLITPNMGGVDYQNKKGAISYEVIKNNASMRFVNFLPGTHGSSEVNSDPLKIIRFKPGDTAYIAPQDLWVTQTTPDGTVDFYSDDYGMGNTKNPMLMGSYATLDLVDNKYQETVASTRFLITP